MLFSNQPLHRSPRKPSSPSYLRSLCRGLGVFTAAIVSVAASCDEPPVANEPRFISAGANAAVIHNMDHGRFDLRSVENGQLRQQFVDVYDASKETLNWYSTWGSQKPFCVMVSPRRDMLDEGQQALGKGDGMTNGQGLEPSLRCVDAKDPKVVHRVDLELPFHNVALDPTGRHLVLFSGATKDYDPLITKTYENSLDKGLFNRNLAAVVDLETYSKRTLTLNGFGAEFKEVVFPEVQGSEQSFLNGGQSQQLAVFSADDEVVLVDLLDPALFQSAVRLQRRAVGIKRRFKLRKADKTVEYPLLVVGDGSAELESLRLSPKAGGARGFSVDYSILSLPAPGLDFEFVQVDGKPWMVSATSGDLVLTQLLSAEQFQVSAVRGVQEIEVETDPQGGIAAGRIVAWGRGNDTIYTLDATKIASSLGRVPKTYRVSAGINAMHPVGANRVAIESMGVLTLLDFASEQQTPFKHGMAGVRDVVYPGGKYLYQFGGNNLNDMELSRIDLDTLVPETKKVPGRTDSRLILFNQGQTAALVVKENEAEDFSLAHLPVEAGSLAELRLGNGSQTARSKKDAE